MLIFSVDLAAPQGPSWDEVRPRRLDGRGAVNKSSVRRLDYTSCLCKTRMQFGRRSEDSHAVGDGRTAVSSPREPDHTVSGMNLQRKFPQRRHHAAAEPLQLDLWAILFPSLPLTRVKTKG